MQNQDITAFIPSADNSYVSILRVKDQIPDLRLCPGNAGTVTVLCRSATAMADDVLAICSVIKYPIHKPGAVQTVGPVGTCGAVACRRDLCEPPPAAVPAQDKAFDSDR